MSLNFIWVDGARPKPAGVVDYVADLLSLNQCEYILQLSSPRVCRRWSTPTLIQVTSALNYEADVGWMLWGHADEAKCHQQIAWLTDRFLTAECPYDLPSNIQWDLEYQWEHASGPLARKCTKILQAGMKAIRMVALDRWNMRITFSVTAITRWPKPEFHYNVQMMLDLREVDEGYAQCYKFHNTKAGHWSQGMPAVGHVINTILPAWLECGVDSVHIGLAAHMQTFPGDPDPHALNTMKAGMEYASNLFDTVPSVWSYGHWSWKNIKKHAGKRKLISGV